MNKVSDHTPASWCWSRWCSRYAAASPGTQDGVSSWQPGFGLPSLWSALLAPCKLNLWNTIYLLWWSKPKVDAAASTFPPTTVGLFLSNFKCQKGPPRLLFLGPPSGYDLPRYPPVVWWGVRFFFLQSVLWETPYPPLFTALFVKECERRSGRWDACLSQVGKKSCFTTNHAIGPLHRLNEVQENSNSAKPWVIWVFNLCI